MANSNTVVAQNNNSNVAIEDIPLSENVTLAQLNEEAAMTEETTKTTKPSLKKELDEAITLILSKVNNKKAIREAEKALLAAINKKEDITPFLQALTALRENGPSFSVEEKVVLADLLIAKVSELYGA